VASRDGAPRPDEPSGADPDRPQPGAPTVEELSRRNRELAALNRLGELAGAERDLAAFFARAVEILRDACGCDGVGVYVLDEPAGELVLVHGVGAVAAAVERYRRLPVAGEFGAVVREGAARVVVADDLGGGIGELGFGSGAWVPLVARGRSLGVFVVGFAGPEERVRAALDLLVGAGVHFASAIESSRLVSDLQRRVGELRLLHEVGRSMVASLETEQVLDIGMKNLSRSVDCPIALLALATAGGDELEIRAVAGAPPTWLGLRYPTSSPEATLAARAFHARDPVEVEDALTDPRVRQDLRARTGGRAYVGLPLLVRDRSIGSVLLIETRRPRRFTPAELERATAIANQLAVAVENARLYEDLSKSYAELGRAQRQLLEQERLAALGEISAVVAHEVRNPLGVIFNSLGSLRRLVRPTGDAKLLLDIVGEEADRLNRIVGDLLDFARPSLPHLRPERLEVIVEDAVRAAIAQGSTAIELRVEREPDLPTVGIDARLVRQAVLNVAANAVQAMPRGGTVTLRTRRDGEGVLVELEDSGAGIPDHVRGRIFEPFFTTKASGTGLGLAVVKRILDGHGGTIDLTSAAGAGTTVRLRFPLAPADDKEDQVG
jgi:signal transduction histidine kinase